MKVLFLTYDIPYPLISGGKIRAYFLIKGLAQKHQITLFTWYRREEQKQYLGELKKYCQKIVLFKRKKPWSWQHLVRSLFTPLPFASATYYSEDFKKALIRELQTGKYDLVHFESFYPALYLPLVKRLGVKTLMANENVEYQVYERYAKSKKFFLLKWLLLIEVFRMRLFEEKLWGLADYNIALSQNDAQVIKKVTQKPCPIVPNAVNAGSYQEAQYLSDRKKLIFIGTLIYQGNSDAIRYMLTEIFPLIKARTKEVKFILVSWHKPKWLEKYLSDRAIIFLQDKETPAAELLGSADLLVAPMRIASGTNIKILEAMAAGLPVITTTVGTEGLGVTPGINIMVADNREEFGREVTRLLNNKEYRQKIGQAGRKYVEKSFDWSESVRILEKVYNSIQENRGPLARR